MKNIRKIPKPIILICLVLAVVLGFVIYNYRQTHLGPPWVTLKSLTGEGGVCLQFGYTDRGKIKAIDPKTREISYWHQLNCIPDGYWVDSNTAFSGSD